MFNTHLNSQKCLISLSNKLYSRHIAQLGNSTLLRNSFKFNNTFPGSNYLDGSILSNDCLLTNNLDLIESLVGNDIFKTLEGNEKII